MTTISVETINGKPHTLIWNGYTPSDAAQTQIIVALNGVRYSVYNGNDIIATALPPLPRRPTAADAGLLHLYAAHGVYVELTAPNSDVAIRANCTGYFCGADGKGFHTSAGFIYFNTGEPQWDYFRPCLTGGALHNGQPCDVAIEGDA